MKSIVTHSLMHEVSGILFLLMQDKEPAPDIYEKCRIAVTEKISLASILAPNFAILCELTGSNMDPSDCDNIAERMYNVIKQDDAVQTFSPMARLMSSDTTPAEKMFALLGAGVITKILE